MIELYKPVMHLHL